MGKQPTLFSSYYCLFIWSFIEIQTIVNTFRKGLKRVLFKEIKKTVKFQILIYVKVRVVALNLAYENSSITDIIQTKFRFKWIFCLFCSSFGCNYSLVEGRPANFGWGLKLFGLLLGGINFFGPASRESQNCLGFICSKFLSLSLLQLVIFFDTFPVILDLFGLNNPPPPPTPTALQYLFCIDMTVLCLLTKQSSSIANMTKNRRTL